MPLTMTRSSFLRSALCGMAVAVVRPPSARAATTAWGLSGRYRYTGGLFQREQLDLAIEDVVSEMNFIIRPIARSRLSDALYPAGDLDFSFDDTHVRFHNPATPPLRTPVNGAPTTWVNQEGARVKVSASFEGNTLRIYFRGDGGNSVYRYRFDPETERLHVRARITHERLPKPINFGLSYRRV